MKSETTSVLSSDSLRRRMLVGGYTCSMRRLVRLREVDHQLGRRIRQANRAVAVLGVHREYRPIAHLIEERENW